MKVDDCVKLEKDRAFKYEYLRRTAWWKTILLIAPSLFLFLGLFGMVYLLKLDLLISWYTLPFGVLFVIGTIWLKAIKKHIQKTKVDDAANFHVCMAKTIGIKDGYVYFIFANNEKRHNEHYISTLAKDISLDDVDEAEISQAKKKAVLFRNENEDAGIYMKAYTASSITKQNKDWEKDNSFPVLAIDEKQVAVIKRKDFQ